MAALALLLVLCSALPPKAAAQDLPPAPPPPAEQTPTQPQSANPPQSTSQPPRTESAGAPESDEIFGGINVPDVTNWTVSDAIEYAEQNRLVVIAIVAAIVLTFLWIGNIIGPGSTAKLAGRDVKALPAPIWLFGACLVFIAPPLAAQFLSQLPEVTSGGSLRERALVQGGAVAAGAIIGMALLFVMSKTAPKAALRFKFSDVPIGIGAFLLALPIVLLASHGAVYAYTQLYDAPPNEIAHPTLELILANKSNQWAMLLAGIAILGSPLVEEILYRGFLQSALLRFTNGQIWLSILGSSALFALVHRMSTDPVPWHALFPIFVLGVCMGVAYERTKRIGVPIAMHVCFNAMNVALAWSGNA